MKPIADDLRERGWTGDVVMTPPPSDVARRAHVHSASCSADVCGDEIYVDGVALPTRRQLVAASLARRGLSGSPPRGWPLHARWTDAAGHPDD